MKANREIGLVVVGSEILDGHIHELNGAYLGRICQNLGFRLSRVVIVGDNEVTIAREVRRLAAELRIIVICGGTGHTADDVTHRALAHMTHCPLVSTRRTEKLARDNYMRLGRTHAYVTEAAVIPKGATPFGNSVGTSLIYKLRWRATSLLVLPGVPVEFRVAIQEHLKELISVQETGMFRSVVIRTRFVSEELIWNTLVPELWPALSDYGQVSSLPDIAAVDIRIRLAVTSLQSYREVRRNILARVRATKLWPHVWATTDETLESILCRLLAAQKKSVYLRWDAHLATSLGSLLGSCSRNHERLTARLEGSSTSVDKLPKSGLRISIKMTSPDSRPRIQAQMRDRAGRLLRQANSPIFRRRDMRRANKLALFCLFDLLTSSPKP
ncbi:Putative competence-damage inducible protein [Lacunisphaera limnophila]|uniref:Competence-damage inducible protein n=2 Tax=Lacunisphaera limnophila TaxID=1838286 RepID=A0A1D8AYZ4_9BACT|nr:Putative competence-damage inducible protein [Lacunisphaera limnophila]